MFPRLQLQSPCWVIACHHGTPSVPQAPRQRCQCSIHGIKEPWKCVGRPATNIRTTGIDRNAGRQVCETVRRQSRWRTTANRRGRRCGRTAEWVDYLRPDTCRRTRGIAVSMSDGPARGALRWPADNCSRARRTAFACGCRAADSTDAPAARAEPADGLRRTPISRAAPAADSRRTRPEPNKNQRLALRRLM